MKMKRVSIWLVFILFCSFTLADKTCNYNALTECKDLQSFGNHDLSFFAGLGSNRQLKRIFQQFNVVRTVESEGHRQVQKFIKSYLTSLGWDILEDNFTASTPVGHKTFANIVGSSSRDAPLRLALACHYDSKDFGAELGGRPFLGATDSAVPCAIILQVASALRVGLEKRKMDLGLDLVFFDGEEAFGTWTDSNSIYGAKNLARRWQSEVHAPLNRGRCSKLQSLVALVLLDLVGERGMQFSNLYSDNGCSSSLYDHFAVTEQRLKLLKLVNSSVSPIFNTDRSYEAGAGIQDDHLPFLASGVNIVHLIAVPFPSVWHTAEDTEQALHWPTIAAMNDVMRTGLASFFDLESADFRLHAGASKRT